MKQNNNTFIAKFVSEYRQLSSTQKFLYFLLTFLLCSDLKLLFIAVEARLGVSAFSDFFNIVIIAIAVFGSYMAFAKRIRIWDFAILLFLVFFHQVSALWFPRTATYSEANAAHFIWECLPMFLVGLTIDRKTSPVIFVGISYFALFLQILTIGVLGLDSAAEGSEHIDSMVRAYNFLPFACLIVWYSIENGGLFNIIMSLISIFLLFSMGARGPIVCFVSFVVIYLVFFKELKHAKYIKPLLIVSFLVFFQFSKELASFLATISSFFGLSTRVFTSIQEETLVNYQESSGRDNLYYDAIDYISRNDVYFGEGLYSDRYITGTDQYVHNLEIELLCDFGWIGGSILILLLALFVARAFNRVKGTQGAIFLLVFFCTAIIGAQFSGSFLTTSVIWFFWGMCATMQRERA